MCIYILWNTYSCTHSWTHTHTCSVSVSFSVPHTPLVFILGVSGKLLFILFPLSLLLAAVPSLLSLFHSKQNKMKSNTNLIWLLQENLKYAVFRSLRFPSPISHLALPQRWNITCQVFLRHTFFWKNWKQLFRCWAINLAQGCTALRPSALILTHCGDIRRIELAPFYKWNTWGSESDLFRTITTHLLWNLWWCSFLTAWI